MKERKKISKSEVLEMREAAIKLKKEMPEAIIIGANAGFGTCSVCGAKNEELRPYGKNGADICYSCGQKNLRETEKNMRKYLFND